MPGPPEPFDLRSHNLPDDKRRELLRLFPEVRTEGGKLDFDRLKLALGETVDVGKERYGMNWPGKADCFRTIQAPSLATLRPAPEESVNFDTTENLIIEGDNLEVLLLLFVAGVMNLAWVALLAALVLVERTVPGGAWLGRVAGIGFGLWGVRLLLRAT
jgi:hypothetical protein